MSEILVCRRCAARYDWSAGKGYDREYCSCYCERTDLIEALRGAIRECDAFMLDVRKRLLFLFNDMQGRTEAWDKMALLETIAEQIEERAGHPIPGAEPREDNGDDTRREEQSPSPRSGPA